MRPISPVGRRVSILRHVESTLSSPARDDRGRERPTSGFFPDHSPNVRVAFKITRDHRPANRLVSRSIMFRFASVPGSRRRSPGERQPPCGPAGWSHRWMASSRPDRGGSRPSGSRQEVAILRTRTRSLLAAKWLDQSGRADLIDLDRPGGDVKLEEGRGARGRR